jgi:bifunctional non-homologous end joining protein LigD
MVLPVFEPMLATRCDRVTDEPGWVHEVKWDGVRAIVSGDGSIRSRNGNRIESSYPELRTTAPADCVLDGEIVAFDATGRPSFQLLQSRMHVRAPRLDIVETTPVTLMVFDVLFHREPLVDAPWEERRQRLEALEVGSPALVVDVHDDGPALFEVIRSHDLEGIVSKRIGSRYRPGRRSKDWRKTAHRKTCETVVIGGIGGTGSRAGTFGSLALAMWTDNRLRYVGAVGSGFDQSTLRAVDEALTEMERAGPPALEDATLVPVPVRWVEPVLVAVVEYASWTADGRLRAPVFKGFSATPVHEVTWDREGPP